MKINIIEVPTPMFSEFTLGATPKASELSEKKVIRIVASHETKTRINTSMKLGASNSGVNFDVEGFKTHYSREHSWISGEYQEKYYFVKSKKQGLEQYKEYVKEVVKDVIANYMKLELDEITIELQADKVF